MEHLNFLIFVLLSFVQGAVTFDFRWTGDDNDLIIACIGDNIKLDFPHEGKAKLSDPNWYFIDKYHKETNIALRMGGEFVSMTSQFEDRIVQKNRSNSNLDITLLKVGLKDSGHYKVRIQLGYTFYSRRKFLQVSDAGKGLTVQGAPEAEYDPKRKSYVYVLKCGPFVYQGTKPPIQVEWITPSGAKRRSNRYSDGYYYLRVPDPIPYKGTYTCLLPIEAKSFICAKPTDKVEAKLQIDPNAVAYAINAAKSNKFMDSSKTIQETQTRQLNTFKDNLEDLKDMILTNKNNYNSLSDLTKQVEITGTMHDVKIKQLLNTLENIQKNVLSKIQQSSPKLSSTVSDLQNALKTMTAKVNSFSPTISGMQSKLANLEKTVKSMKLRDQNLAKNMTKLNTDIPESISKLENFFLDHCQYWQKVAPKSGVRTLLVQGKEVKAYCDQDTDGGGWTVFQRRIDGKLSFYQHWKKFADGFGDATKEYWLGLENLHQMTSGKGKYELRIDVERFDGKKFHMKVNDFRIGHKDEFYKLVFRKVIDTNAGDSISYMKNIHFSTYDSDNDNSQMNCAKYRKSSWWFNECYVQIDLNAKYKTRDLQWLGVSSFSKFIAKTEMKFRLII